MKKFLCVLTSLLLILSSMLFAACDTGTDGETESLQSENTSESVSETVSQSESETLEGGAVVVDDIAGKSAYEAYEAAFRDEMTNFTMNSTMVVISEYGASRSVTTMVTSVATDGEKYYCKTSSPDTPYMDSEVWFADGYMYTKSSEEKYKTPMDIEEFILGYVDSIPGGTDGGITEAEFEGSVIVKYEDGTYGLRMDAEKFKDSFFDDSESSEGFDAESFELAFELTFNADGSWKGMNISLVTEMDADGMTVKSTSEATYSVEKIGSTAVELPADADTYEEFDWGLDEEIPDMTDWSEEEIKSWYDEFWGDEWGDEGEDETGDGEEL